MAIAVALTCASVVWLGLLAFAAGHGTSSSLLSDLVYQAAAFICHQKPERSFAWGGAPWPVCGRCLGLYAAAPIGAAFALAVRRRPPASRENFFLLCIAAVPSVVTLVAEVIVGWEVTNVARFVAALPLGAVVAWLLVRTARDSGTRVSQYTLSDARRGESR